MDALECIMTRRSIRKFLDVPVEWDKVGTILNAARMAPSAGNLQNWYFIIVTNPEKRKMVAEACLQQYWIQTAPLIIIVCSITERGSQFYGIRGERLYNVQNCSAACQNMLLAAHAVGLGSCWIGAFDEEMITRICTIPERSRAQAVLAFGYADEAPPTPSKHAIEKFVMLERYKENSGRIKDMEFSLGMYGGFVQDNIKKGGNWLKRVNKKIVRKGQ